MPEERPHRIRIKLADGSELEAEGSAEFVRAERLEFLAGRARPAAMTEQEAAEMPRVAWETVTEAKGAGLRLRTKLTGEKAEKDACLVLVAAAEKLLNLPKPTAAQLAKWLRAYGYPILRVDRALQDGVQKGEILSSGSRRARRYELTAPGRLKACLLASRMTATITGRPS